jgi:hypothetical protein
LVGKSEGKRPLRRPKKILVGKSEGKRPLRRPKCSCKDNTEIYLQETALKNEKMINLAGGRPF